MIDAYFNYKKAVDAITSASLSSGETFKGDINYRYDLTKNPFMTDTKIVLFKASQVATFAPEEIPGMNESDITELKKIVYYYVNQTDDNYLSDFVRCSDLDIVILKSSHSGWMSCDDDIRSIVSVCKNNMNPVLS